MDEKTLVGHADEAMYRAKKNGKNGYRIYDAAVFPSGEQADGVMFPVGNDDRSNEAGGETDS
ncbi:MAG: hypothetical protein MR020_07730, partial [Lachnospiraceae bacterium]|nr:hypothetical protein [Lachnospiraceae bacterium]